MVGTSREQTTKQTRERLIDVARELLGQRPEAGLGDVAEAAGVVRRTVYGHFPSRNDLVQTLAERAAGEIRAELQEVDRPGTSADVAWAAFVARLWPLAHRYQVLLALRRGTNGDQIHAVLNAVDALLATLIRRGQDAGLFGTHLPAESLGPLAYSVVFTIADEQRGGPGRDARAAAVTSLLLLGVPAERARRLSADTKRASA